MRYHRKSKINVIFKKKNTQDRYETITHNSFILALRNYNTLS